MQIGVSMNITVMYHDGKYDIVQAFRLDRFIVRKKIRKFYRHSDKQWVTVGVDPVRKNRREEGHHEDHEQYRKI